MIYWLSLLFCFIICCISTESVSESVKITKWEYCEGCKETVNLFALVTSTELGEMQKRGKSASSILAVQNLVNGICDNVHLNQFNKFVQHSCIKIMDEHQLPFLRRFEGSVSTTSVTHNSAILDQKRKICVDEVHACPANTFNVTNTDRSKCSACNVVAGDIEALKRTVNSKVISLRSVLESESFCGRLGANHAPPYGWLESMCEEMVDDRVGAILEILAFHDQIARTGLAPSQTAAQMMCKEFFHCDEDAEKAVETKDKDKVVKGGAKKKKTKGQIPPGVPVETRAEL